MSSQVSMTSRSFSLPLRVSWSGVTYMFVDTRSDDPAWYTRILTLAVPSFRRVPLTFSVNVAIKKCCRFFGRFLRTNIHTLCEMCKFRTFLNMAQNPIKSSREASHDGSRHSRNKFCKTTNPNLMICLYHIYTQYNRHLYNFNIAAYLPESACHTFPSPS